MSESSSLLDIHPDHLTVVRGILYRHVPDRKVLAFGSRATWHAKDYSDLDLAILGNEPLPLSITSALADAFEESNLPFRVDLLDWARVNNDFRAIIVRDGINLWLPEDNQSLTRTANRSRKAYVDSHWRRSLYGLVVADYCEKPLKNLCVPEQGVQTGPFGSQLHKRDYVRDGTPIITVEHLGENRIIHQNLPLVSDADKKRLSRYSLQVGDIVFSRVGSVDRRSLVRREEEGWLFSGRCIRVRPDTNRIYPEYLAYFFGLKEFRNHINSIAFGATMPSLNTQLLSEIVVTYPPLPQQRAIAHILGTLDDKIELNRRMNETLEAMAQALFKDWFVDFGPVRAKMEGREPYLTPELWNLFPDRMVGSKLGEIPAGWEAKLLTNLININPKRVLPQGEHAPYLGMANMSTKTHVPEKIISRPFSSGMRFINGDTLVARITPCLENGKTAYVDFLCEGGVGWGSTEYIVLRPKPPLPNEFAYCLARSVNFREFAIRNMTGTSGRQRVPAKALSSFLLPLPPKTVSTIFGQIIQSFLAQAATSASESRALSSLRNELLPKFMSGEIRVPNIERFQDTTP